MENRQFKSVQELIDFDYGIKTSHIENPLVAAVGVTAVRILNNSPRRCAYAVINLSANSVYIAPANNVAATKGIYLSPNGGAFYTVYRDDFILPTLELFAIATGAASSIYVLELNMI